MHITRLSKQPLKNIVSMLIKDKVIASYQLLLIKQDRVLVPLKHFLLWLMNLDFFFFYFSKIMGRSSDGKRNILLGWPRRARWDIMRGRFQNINIFVKKKNEG